MIRIFIPFYLELNMRSILIKRGSFTDNEQKISVAYHHNRSLSEINLEEIV